MPTHLWIGLRTPDEFGIFFTRTYGNGEAADDVAYGRMGAPAAFELYLSTAAHRIVSPSVARPWHCGAKRPISADSIRDSA